MLKSPFRGDSVGHNKSGADLDLSEETVLKHLRQKGFLAPVLKWRLQGCPWYEARRFGELWEIEVYTPVFENDLDLKRYIFSFSELSENISFLRKPVETFSEGKHTYIVRDYENSEPLFNYFLRTGAVPEKQATAILMNFEKVCEYLNKHEMENFSPLALLFQVNNEGDVFLDSFRCGPWIKNFGELKIIYKYLEPKLTWKQQVFYFRNRLALKLFLGDPEASSKSSQLNSVGVQAFLSELSGNVETFSENLSSFLKDERSTHRIFSKKTVSLFVVSFIVLFAYVYSQRPYVNNWQGELGAAEPFVKAPLEVGASPQAHDDVENHNFLSARFLSKIQKLNRQKALGYFSDVKSELQVLKEASQYRNEQEYLETYGKGLEIQRSKDFLRLKGVVANLSTVSKYDQARRLLVNSIKNYGVCKEQKLLEDLLAEIPLKEK